MRLPFVLLLGLVLPALTPLEGDARRSAPRTMEHDESLGSLICTLGAEAAPQQGAIGPSFHVACAFTSEGGLAASYRGTLYGQLDAAHDTSPFELGKTFVWFVRGSPDDLARPGFLSDTFTLRSPIAEGGPAALVPKDSNDTSLALYSMTTREERAKTTGKSQNRNIVTSLELALETAPA